MCYAAGREPKVRLFDTSEFNPVAESFRTARLVANMLIYFAMGLAHRAKAK